MLKLIRTILGKTNNVSRSTYFWNAFNATASACQSTLIIMVMARTNNIYDVGIFSIAYAIAALMLYVGQYGVRKYQASDVNEQFALQDYMGLRIATCIIMILASVMYCVYGVVFRAYGAEKFIVIILVCLVKVIQAFADVLHGRMQQMGRLDIAAKASAGRIVISTLFYMLALVLTGNLVLSTLVWFVSALLVFMATSVNAMRDFGGMGAQFKWIPMKGILIEGFPLFVSTFLNVYIGNAPKYAIDACLTEDVQAYYNLLFMPAFAVTLLCNFIFNPIINTYAKIWAEQKLKEFRKVVVRQLIVIMLMTIAGVLVAATIGIPLLSIIFGVDLAGYKTTLIIVMLGGGAFAYVTFLTTVLTIIRHQKSFTVCYGVISLIALLCSKHFVLEYGLNGAAAMYTVLMTALMIMFAITTVYHIKKDSILFKEEN